MTNKLMSYDWPDNRALTVGWGLLLTTRPHQWYKQSILLLGIVFSRNLLNLAAWMNVLAAVVAFTCAAGGMYTLNDVLDRENDRRHPEKRNRPIASGQVPVGTAVIAGILMLAGALVISWFVGPLLAVVIGTYLVQNVLYSAYLKSVVLVDVLVVAVGFVLRAIAGVVAINVFLSPWLVVCTFLLALVLALGKRRHEMETVPVPRETRTTLDGYTSESLDQLLLIATSTLLMAYALYTFNRADYEMMVTLPFAFYGVFRYHYLVHRTDLAGHPEYLLLDRPSLVNLLLWSSLATAVLYEIPEVALGALL